MKGKSQRRFEQESKRIMSNRETNIKMETIGHTKGRKHMGRN
jgi:hypothetical protein